MQRWALPNLDELRAWNIALFEHWRATSASSHRLIDIASLMAEIPLYASAALTLGWIAQRRDRDSATWIGASIAIGLLLEHLVALTSFSPRPFAAGFGPAWVYHAATNSMPSTHVTATWSMALVAFLQRRYFIGPSIFALGLLMAWARIYVGIHWPADMLGAAASACLSVAIARFAQLAIRRLTPFDS